MKMYDSLKTINFAHELMKGLDIDQQDQFTKALRDLFDKKQVSEEREYKTFLITKEDVESIYKDLFGKLV